MPAYVYKKGRVLKELKEIPCSMQSLDVSVVLPTYNEAAGIERIIAALSAALKKYKYEIVVVDDNSKDDTPQIIDRLAAKGHVAALHRFGIRGIFSAINDGVRVAEGKIIVIMDADFSHPPALVPRMLSSIKDFDLVSGSRFCSCGGVNAPGMRKFSTTAFNSAIRFVLGINITDWTGGFHAIRKDAYKRLRFKYPSSWGEFDLELLFRARKSRLKILEIPFVYNFREEGTSKSAEGLSFFFGYALKYGLRALRLRFFDWL
jgi:dolichol-phosphate mannosyltransferase